MWGGEISSYPGFVSRMIIWRFVIFFVILNVKLECVKKGTASRGRALASMNPKLKSFFYQSAGMMFKIDIRFGIELECMIYCKTFANLN